MRPLSRRAFVALAAALAMPRWARGQSAERIRRLGWLGAIDGLKEPQAVAFVQRLRELGFADGSNLQITYRHAGGRLERLPSLATELRKLNPDLLFGSGPEANLSALRQAGGDAPIVFVAVDFDPVATGYVANPARPGGRITGVTAVQSALPGKRMELLKELLPGTRKVAVLGNDQTTGQFAVAEEAAKRLAQGDVNDQHFSSDAPWRRWLSEARSRAIARAPGSGPRLRESAAIRISAELVDELVDETGVPTGM
jgi:putative tryptophan/tyrosine transport system substrate-binding protein